MVDKPEETAGTQPAPEPPAAAPSVRPPSRWVRRLKRLVLAGLLLAVAGLLTVVGIFVYYGRDLPTFEKLTDYRPPQASRVLDRHGEMVAEYFRERRTVVAAEQIPDVMKKAVVAAEDGAFYEHAGLDYVGIARAVFKDIKQMRLAQGASTITQQVVKNMVLSPERSMARKVKEAILARRLEQNLTKDEILWLYLNHIYFGHGRHGVEEAARFYFGKSVKDVTLGEAAVLAGLPQSPIRLSPLKNPEKAKARQTYVLRQMAQNGFITPAQADAEIARPIAPVEDHFQQVGDYYIEDVRKQLMERYGETALYEGGLRVEIGMDRRLQQLADEAVRSGLEDVQRRAGFRPPDSKLDLAVMGQAKDAFAKIERKGEFVWDLSGVGAEALKSAEALDDAVHARRLKAGAVVTVPVSAVSEAEALFELGTRTGRVTLEALRWTRLKKASDAFAPGHLVRVRVVSLPPKPAEGVDPSPVELDVVPLPKVQGALVAIDPKTRHVVALTGGYDFARSSYNRATQAKRQPGSSFKPLVYAAALASGKYTTASILNDAPDIIRDPWTGAEWQPQNYERGEYEGPMTLREALAKSKNTISVGLIQAIGHEAVVDFARRAGIGSELPASLTLALGSGEVLPIELANAYTTLATMGQRADPILITRVTDSDGKVLEVHRAVPEETLPPAVAYIVTSLMESVIEIGTGVRAKELRRPVAGKTGTASDNKDAWFSGFTADYVATVWVGFDTPASIGRGETGGKAALPIWLSFMLGAHERLPASDFPVPPGIEKVRIDPLTGMRTQDDSGRLEVFAAGTAPTELAPRAGEADPNLLFLEDGGRRWP